MNTLYLLSGPPRAGKTTIMKALVKATGVQLVAGDALEHGLRNVLTGEPHELLERIELNGFAEYKTSLTEIGGRKPFRNAGTESELLLQAVEGMLDYYQRNKESVAMEGTEFSPAWAAELRLPGFAIKAAFVGFTDPAHADAILAHAQANGHDWINEWLQQENGDDTKIREWAQKRAQACSQLKTAAEQHGFPFFDISARSFDKHVSAALHYYLQD